MNSLRLGSYIARHEAARRERNTADFDRVVALLEPATRYIGARPLCRQLTMYRTLARSTAMVGMTFDTARASPMYRVLVERATTRSKSAVLRRGARLIAAMYDPTSQRVMGDAAAMRPPPLAPLPVAPDMDSTPRPEPSAELRSAYLRRLHLDPGTTFATRCSVSIAPTWPVPYETTWLHMGERWGIDPASSSNGSRKAGARLLLHLNGSLSQTVAMLATRCRITSAACTAGAVADDLTNHLVLTVGGLPTRDNRP